MQINREEAIRVMQDAIKDGIIKQLPTLEGHPDNSDWICGLNGVMTISLLAESALDALVDYLPIITKIIKPEFNGDIRYSLEAARDINIQNSKAADIYQELKSWGSK